MGAAFLENAFKNPRTGAITALRWCCASACQKVTPRSKLQKEPPALRRGVPRYSSGGEGNMDV